MDGGDRGDMGVSCGGDVSGVTGDMGSSVCHPLLRGVDRAVSCACRVGAVGVSWPAPLGVSLALVARSA